MKKVILLSDTTTIDYFRSKKQGKIVYKQVFTKNASGLRLAYSLRKRGIYVVPLYNYTAFSSNEFEAILKSHSDNGKNQLYVCISTSFMVPGLNRNIFYNTIDHYGIWGDYLNTTINFLAISKKYNATTIMGGWAVHNFQLPSIHSKLIDLFVEGDGTEIIDKLAGESNVSLNGKFLSRDGHRIYIASEIKDFSDQSSSPLPMDHIMQGEALNSELSGGCIFSCSFCNYKLLGKKKYEFQRSYESLKQELKHNYDNFGTTFYTFTDNIMNDYLPKLEMLSRIRDELQLDIRWVGYSRLDVITNKAHAQLIKDSGAAGLLFGVESFTKSVGPYIGKMTDGDRIKESLHVVRDILKDDALINLSLIGGAPTETPDMLNNTVDYLNSPEGKHLVDNTFFSPLIIYKNQSEKNDINKARNNPFRDYETKSSTEWNSPWGDSKTFQNLCRDFNIAYKNYKQINTFNLPNLHNGGISLSEGLRLVRTNAPMDTEIFANFRETTDINIRNYVNNVLQSLE